MTGEQVTGALAALLDRETIRDCIARVARGEDRRDRELLAGGFWPDAHIDMGIFTGGFDEYAAWVVPGSPAIGVTQHFLGQSVIDLRDENACAETHVQSYHRILAADTSAGAQDMTIGGRYLDEMQRRGDQWRILRRTLLYDWLQHGGASVDWSDGVLGTPFLGDHYTGRSIGDHSETFFGKRHER